MLAIVSSATLTGVEGCPVTVEIHLLRGVPSFRIVGLPDAAVRESRDRVRAALLSSGLDWPDARVTVNLAPSGIRKGGAGIDLAIAVGLLVVNEALDHKAIEGKAFLGELGLDGTIRAVPGTVPLVDALSRNGQVVVASSAHHDAALVGADRVRSVDNLETLYAVLTSKRSWPEPLPVKSSPTAIQSADLADVRGQPTARRALEIAAAGGHHLLMVGPPGSGKTMLASRLPGLLPPLEDRTALEVTLVHSAAGRPLPAGDLIRQAPFRAPHRGASAAALVGGGHGTIRPGEISLAHGGTLFLDELGEFATHVLEGLRQPLEEGIIRVSRAATSAAFPARFVLVAAMNACPCGDSAPNRCRCSPASRTRYSRRVSGPLLDRFDLRVLVQRPPAELLLDGPAEESSEAVAERVARARARAATRGVRGNAELSTAALDEESVLDPDGKALLEDRVRDGGLSARGVNRVRTVALTIADLEDDEPVLSVRRLATALSMRVDIGGLR